MTAPADLEAVKAMLVDAVFASWVQGDEPWLGGRDNRYIGYIDVGLIDADKLAATVAEWFAARDEGRA